MNTTDFVSVEDAERGYDVKVWTIDGDSLLIANYSSYTVAAACAFNISAALLTWPGFEEE